VLSGLSAGLGAALGTAGSYASTVARTLQSEETVNTLKTTGASFWSGLSSSVSTVAATIVAPDSGSDGLTELQRQIAAQKPANIKYSGFGSKQVCSLSTGSNNNNNNTFASSSMPSQSGMLQEAPGLPHEDRNGVERLTGETDEQYVIRQTRLRDEARARMQAKFGNGGLSSASSSAYSPFTNQPTTPSGMSSLGTNSRMQPHSAPSTGNFPRPLATTPR